MSSQPNSSLVAGLALVTEICAASEAMSGRQLARSMGLHHAKVNRLLMTLAEIGVLRQDHQRKYVPAGGLHVLAALALHGSGLMTQARPIILDLHQQLPQATVAVGVLWQDQVAYLYHAHPQTLASAPLPRLHPVDQSSIGQLLVHVQAYAAEVHDGHRSIAVPIYQHGQAVAGLAITNVSMRRKVEPLVAMLQQAAKRITDQQPEGTIS